MRDQARRGRLDRGGGLANSGWVRYRTSTTQVASAVLGALRLASVHMRGAKMVTCNVRALGTT